MINGQTLRVLNIRLENFLQGLPMRSLFIAVAAIFALSTIDSHALIIKGEESNYHFVKIEENQGRYIFSECHGDFDAFSCEPFFPEGESFSKSEIDFMAKDKKAHSIFAGFADVAIIVVAVRFLPVLAANAEINWALRAGYSLDGGVGAASGAIAGLTVTPVLSSTTMIFDILDPFVHRDLALSLEASIDEADLGELDDIETQDLKLDRVVTIEDVTSEQVVNSFRKLTEWTLKKRTLNGKILEKLEGYRIH